jgi:methionyl-tRNA synthetase
MGRLTFLTLIRKSQASSKSWSCHSCTRRQSTQANAKPHYITTPIFYVNADPHVGHMYSMVLADVLKRFHTLRGRITYLSTGTDEHGLKVQKAAQVAGTTPQELCDKEAETFKKLAQRANISYDMFVRTTSPTHVKAVEFAWRKLRNTGYIYTSKHKGWYCVSDETFYPESSVKKQVDPKTGVEQMVRNSCENSADNRFPSKLANPSSGHPKKTTSLACLNSETNFLYSTKQTRTG